MDYRTLPKSKATNRVDYHSESSSEPAAATNISQLQMVTKVGGVFTGPEVCGSANSVVCASNGHA